VGVQVTFLLHPSSGILNYQVKIGTTCGNDDVLPFQILASGGSLGGLTLSEYQTYCPQPCERSIVLAMLALRSQVMGSPTANDDKSISFQAGLGQFALVATTNSCPLYRPGAGTGASDGWSAAFWLKTDNSGGSLTQTIFSYGDIRLDTLSSTALKLTYGAPAAQLSLTTGSILSIGDWQHVLVTYSGGTTGQSSASLNAYYQRFKIFVNGTEYSQSVGNLTGAHIANGTSATMTASYFYMGSHGSGNYFQGKIDDFALFSGDVSASAASIYNNGSRLDLKNLSLNLDHWWRMGDGDSYPLLIDEI
jgi:hypothetical protein